MKTSNTVTNLGDRNTNRDVLFKFYLKNQLRPNKCIDGCTTFDIGNQTARGERKLKPSAMKRCFRKWRSFWKLKGCSDAVRERTTDPDFTDIIKREPPKSLPLTRRCDHLNYGPLIHGNDSNTRYLHGDKKAQDSGILFVPPPPLPLRQCVTNLNSVELNIMTTQPTQNYYSRSSKYNHLMESFRKLKQVSWYWGPLSKYDAELLLLNKENGVFLVRDSGHEAYVLSVSFRAGSRTYHTRVEHSAGKFSFWLSDHNAMRAANIVEFINQLIEESKNGHVRYLISDTHINSQIVDTHHHPSENGRVSVALLTPLSRFKTVQTLAHLCRFQILLLIRRDHIGELRIPTFLKIYLQSSQYFVEKIEDFL